MDVICEVFFFFNDTATTEIYTAGTLIEIVRALEREGVSEIYACATHGVLSADAVDRIRDSSLRELILTDSIPLPPSKRIGKIKTFSIAPLIGEAIKRIHRGESVGALFSSDVALTQQMLMWEDGIARTLDLRDEDVHEATATDLPMRATPMAARFAATKPGDR